jgi:glycosyltransferase involved in cell wall biosynthesis
MSNKNITWKINVWRDELSKYYSEARAFLFPPEEDFWIAPIEAMASWTPVIAYNKWWAKETVINWKTWIFFENQSVRSLNNAIEDFERLKFNNEEIRKIALNFTKERFKENLLNFIKNKLNN